MRWAWLLGLLVLTAGCLGGIGDETRLTPQEAEELDASELEEIERELVFETDIALSAGDGRIEDPGWSAPLGPGLVDLAVELAWEQEAHAFGLDVEGPDGSVHEIGPEQDPTASRIGGELADVEAGTYAFHPTRQGAVTTDALTLTVTATFQVPADEDVRVQGCTDIQVQETSSGYRASFTCQASGPTSQAKHLGADTVNGEIRVDGDAEGALASVEAWARASTAQEARQRAQAIDVDVLVTGDEIRALAEAPEWEERGADVSLEVAQATLTGEADATNGPISFMDVLTDGIAADTTNGAIEGDLTGGGDIELDATNGPVEVAFTPQQDTSLETDTTNGPIELGLAESDRIAYTIDAASTNGQITESMDEAHLEGSEDRATLVTEDGASRAVQVTGETDATNGDVHFEGR